MLLCITPFSLHEICKSKVVPLRHARAKKERRYSFYSFLTSALDGVSVSVTPRSRFTPGTHLTGGWEDHTVGMDTRRRRKKSFATSGDRNPVDQSVSHYTDIY
jgi:hypothetical protein